MELLTKKIHAELKANYEASQKAGPEVTVDHKPVVKFFNPAGMGTWLITEMDDDEIMFGLCDLGYPELGYVSLAELREFKGVLGLGIERDLYFTADRPLSEYTEIANEKGHIDISAPRRNQETTPLER